MPNSYNSAFTGEHNDEYDERIIALNNTKVNRSGDTMTGQLIIEGIAGDDPLIVRGISGRANDVTNAPGDLYLNYNRSGFVDILNNTLKITTDTATINGLLKIAHNGNTVTIGSQNAGFCHIYSSADIPFIFNKTIATTSGTLGTSSYPWGGLVLGSAAQIVRQGSGRTWVKGRDGAILRQTTIDGYSPAISLKTNAGSWQIGVYNDSSFANKLIFSYTTDSNYNSNNNAGVQATISAAGAFTNASKRELKENIQLVNYSCLDVINSIKICSFNMIGDSEKDYRIGFIADDTDPIVSGKNQDVMDLQNCIGVLLKAVQELDQKIKILENKIKALQE